MNNMITRKEVCDFAEACVRRTKQYGVRPSSARFVRALRAYVRTRALVHGQSARLPRGAVKAALAIYRRGHAQPAGAGTEAAA